MANQDDITQARTAFAQAVRELIRDLCKLTFNISREAELQGLFGMTLTEMQLVIEQIVAALPADLFKKANRTKREEVKKICAREFIFFQVQEKYNDPHYQETLAHFIYAFKRDMVNKI